MPSLNWLKQVGIRVALVLTLLFLGGIIALILSDQPVPDGFFIVAIYLVLVAEFLNRRRYRLAIVFGGGGIAAAVAWGIALWGDQLLVSLTWLRPTLGIMMVGVVLLSSLVGLVVARVILRGTGRR